MTCFDVNSHELFCIFSYYHRKLTDDALVVFPVRHLVWVRTVGLSMRNFFLTALALFAIVVALDLSLQPMFRMRNLS